MATVVDRSTGPGYGALRRSPTVDRYACAVRYVGQSRAVRWWPPVVLVSAIAMYFLGGGYLVLPGALVVCGIVTALIMPWRFAVVDDGIALWFPFGRRRFFRRERLTVRVDEGGAIAYPGAKRRFGYPLFDGLSERRRWLLRAVLIEHGFRVIT
jgi:hypothetical protein